MSAGGLTSGRLNASLSLRASLRGDSELLYPPADQLARSLEPATLLAAQPAAAAGAPAAAAAAAGAAPPLAGDALRGPSTLTLTLTLVLNLTLALPLTLP